MANTCENTLVVTGDKKEIAQFMANVFEVEYGGIEYRVSNNNDSEVFPFGLLQNRDESSIVFDSNWNAPIDNILEMSKQHVSLGFTLTYVIPNDETVGIAVIKGAKLIRDEFDDYSSDLSAEVIGSEYVQELLNEDLCKNFLKLEGKPKDISDFMLKIIESEEQEIEYKVSEEGETLYLGLLKSKETDSIVFHGEYEAPIDEILEISQFHKTLTFTLSYALLGNDEVGRVKIKDEEVLDQDEDDIYSDLAREILGDEYVDGL